MISINVKESKGFDPVYALKHLGTLIGVSILRERCPLPKQIKTVMNSREMKSQTCA